MWDPVLRIGRTINVRIRIKLGTDLAALEWTARGCTSRADGRTETGGGTGAVVAAASAAARRRRRGRQRAGGL